VEADPWEPFIKLPPWLPLADQERLVRTRAAKWDDVFVLAESRGWRQLRRLRQRLENEPVPGRSVKVLGRPGGGGLLWVTAEPSLEPSAD
jgi:hypothetical protein